MQPKSVLKNRKSDFDGYLDDDELAEDTSQPIQPEPANDTNNIVSIASFWQDILKTNIADVL